MLIERRLGDRLKVVIHQVAGMTPSVHHLLENDLSAAYNRLVTSASPVVHNPTFRIAEGGWQAVSSVSGECLASFSLVAPKRGRPRP